MYCTASEVYAASQLDSSVVAEADVNGFIKASEREVDLLTYTTYWVQQTSGTASAGTSTTLEDNTQTWDVDAYTDYYVWVYEGTGSGQVRKITSNTADTLTVNSSFNTTPDDTSKYRIFYSAKNPIYIDDKFDGSGSTTFFVPNLPIVDIEKLSVYKNRDTETSITLSSLYIYKKQGKITLSNTSECTYFYDTYPQMIELFYSFGVYPIPEEVKRYVIVSAAERMLSAQMGSTYNVPSTYSLPEGSVTIGQAYINIDGTAKRLYQEKKDLAKILVKYPTMA